MKFRDVIDLWPRVCLAKKLGVSSQAVGMWWQRDSIPSTYFDAVVTGARALGRGDITHELLCKLAARRLDGRGDDGQ